MALSKKELALQIVENLGGESNVKDVSFCMTRLRVVPVDASKVNDDGLSKIKGVMKVMKVGTQYQIVLGGIVDEVYTETVTLLGKKPSDEDFVDVQLDEDVKGGKKNVLSMLVETLSSIVSPVIPAMLASGFIATAVALAEAIFKVPDTNSTLVLLSAIANTLYEFFPVIIGWSAARKFGANIGVSLIIVGVLVNPSFTGLFTEGANVTFLGIPVTNVYYGSSVLPAILSTYLLAKTEKFFRSILPQALRSIFVPFLSALIIAPLTLVAIGPIGVWGGNAFASIFTRLYELSPILAGGIIGGTWQILIIFGMHIAILGLVSVPNIAAFGRDTVIMTHAPSLMCQIAAGLAVALKAKDPEIKKTAFTLSLTSFFAGNVIEPVMYGVNLKYKKPFIAVCIGGAIGGAITGASFAGTTAAVAFSLYTIPAYLGAGFGGLLVGVAVGSVVTFVLTWILGIDESIA